MLLVLFMNVQLHVSSCGFCLCDESDSFFCKEPDPFLYEVVYGVFVTVNQCVAFRAYPEPVRQLEVVLVVSAVCTGLTGRETPGYFQEDTSFPLDFVLYHRKESTPADGG